MMQLWCYTLTYTGFGSGRARLAQKRRISSSLKVQTLIKGAGSYYFNFEIYKGLAIQKKKSFLKNFTSFKIIQDSYCKLFF